MRFACECRPRFKDPALLLKGLRKGIELLQPSGVLLYGAEESLLRKLPAGPRYVTVPAGRLGDGWLFIVRGLGNDLAAHDLHNGARFAGPVKIGPQIGIAQAADGLAVIGPQFAPQFC